VFKDQKIIDFLERLSSNSPTPGGGTVAAVVASFSAALGAMVASLSQGERFALISSHMKEIEGLLKEKSDLFLQLAEEDKEAFQLVMKARKKPKEDPAREREIQESLKYACLPPLVVMENISLLLPVLRFLCEQGNKNLLSDVGIACSLSESAIYSSTLNVLLNLSNIKDQIFAVETLRKLEKFSLIGQDFQRLTQSVKYILGGERNERSTDL
jgi:formiminotetrahydrofolate cyclodeaminase